MVCFSWLDMAVVASKKICSSHYDSDQNAQIVLLQSKNMIKHGVISMTLKFSPYIHYLFDLI